MSIPNPLDEASTREAVNYFRAAGFDQVDTAIMYQGGKSEVTLGECRSQSRGRIFFFPAFSCVLFCRARISAVTVWLARALK